MMKWMHQSTPEDLGKSAKLSETALLGLSKTRKSKISTFGAWMDKYGRRTVYTARWVSAHNKINISIDSSGPGDVRKNAKNRIILGRPYMKIENTNFSLMDGQAINGGQFTQQD